MTTRRDMRAEPDQALTDELDVDEAPGYGVITAGYPSTVDAEAVERARAFNAGCATVAAELEAATAVLGPGEALAAARRCRDPDLRRWCEELRRAATLRH